MRIEIRNDSVLLDGYVNAIARDSRPMLDDNGEKFTKNKSATALLFYFIIKRAHFHNPVHIVQKFLTLLRTRTLYNLPRIQVRSFL